MRKYDTLAAIYSDRGVVDRSLATLLIVKLSNLIFVVEIIFYQTVNFEMFLKKWPVTAVEYAMKKDCSIPHRRTSSVANSLCKAGPWFVLMTSGDPNRPTWLSIMEAVYAAVVDLVGNSSTNLVKAYYVMRQNKLKLAVRTKNYIVRTL